MSAAEELEQTGRMLQVRADDLFHVGYLITQRTQSVSWQCAKADRFRAAMDARRAEITRVSAELREVALAVRAAAARAAAEEAAGSAPTA